MVDEWNLENWQEEMLKACGNKYHLIGDCNKVGNIKDAICQAYEVCKNI